MKYLAALAILCLLLSGCSWSATRDCFIRYEDADPPHEFVAKSFVNAGVVVGYVGYGAAIAAAYAAPYAAECLCHLHFH